MNGSSTATIEAARVAYCKALGLHPDGVLFAKVRRNRIGWTFKPKRVVVAMNADGTARVDMVHAEEEQDTRLRTCRPSSDYPDF